VATVRWSDQSLDDLEAICLFIARDSPLAAEIFARRAFESTDMLETFPFSGRIVPGIGRDEIRELIIGNYRLIYRVRGDKVDVLTVHHGARGLGDAL
jgi:plasmid stabilization system protein ParE